MFWRCGGINPPAMQALDEFLRMNQGIDTTWPKKIANFTNVHPNQGAKAYG